MSPTDFNTACGCIDRAAEKLKGQELRDEEKRQVQCLINKLQEAFYKCPSKTRR